jgi:hypothetical protein
MTQNTSQTDGQSVEPAKNQRRAGETALENSPSYQQQAHQARYTLSLHADTLMREQAADPLLGTNGAGTSRLLASHWFGMPKSLPSAFDKTAFLSGHPASVSDKAERTGLFQLAAFPLDTTGTLSTGVGQDRAGLETGVKPEDRVPRDSAHPIKDINVAYQSYPANSDSQPDYRILKDGSLQILRDAAYSTSDKVTIELARNVGDRGDLTQAQQAQLNRLVSDLSGRFMAQRTLADGSHMLGGRVDDPQGLVAPDAVRGQRTTPTPMDELPAETRQQIQRANRWSGSGTGPAGQGRFTNKEAGEEFAPRDVPRQTRSDHETVAVAAMKDVVSGFITRNDKDPYHAVKHWGEEGHRIGRYGTSAAQYRSWLAGLSHSQINDLIAQGKLSKGALELSDFLKAHPDGVDAAGQLTGEAKGLNDFLTKMQKGDDNNKPTNGEIDTYFNKHLQEKMGSDLVRQYAEKTADTDPSKGGKLASIPKIALSMYLGHVVTGEEAQNPRYQAFMDAALKAWPLAVQKEQGTGSIDLSNLAQKLGSLAIANQGRALWRGSGTGANVGCASSVVNLLEQAGLKVPHNYVAAGLGHQMQGLGWVKDDFRRRRPGDIVVWEPSGGGTGTGGHIGVVGSDGQTYANSSGSGQWSVVRYYGGRHLYVLHAPGSTTSA